MSSALPSAEVAADFRDALQDLKINSRPEISNLTVIAKENTEHAQAISRELEEHIRKTRPEWKLPALYVLDSIVKNVGTPYTVYLGRNLYSVFFSAYTVVDAQTRKAMDSLLKTWKQPVPESLDTRPVFDPEVTRSIENALIQYRTKILKQTQPQPQPPVHLQRPPVAQQSQWRNTPTPPQAGYPAPPPAISQFHASALNPMPSPLRQYATPVQNGFPYNQNVTPQFNAPAPAPAQVPDLVKIKADLTQLIFSTTMELAKNPASAAQTQGLLKNLIDLQKILSSGSLHPQALQQVAAEVDRISGMIQSSIASAPVPSQQPTPQPVALPQPPPPQPAALAALLQSFTPSSSTPTLPPAPLPAVPAPAGGPAPPSAAQISQLLASLQPKATPPPLPASIPPPQSSAPPQTDLFASLRAAGLIPGSAIATPPSAPDPTARVRSPVNLLQSLAGPSLRMETASLKVPRPHLLARLYEDKPDQCRQCGRRFAATDAGKRAKAAHMDWHFSVNTRIAEASRGVVNRSWYISELEWIRYREGGAGPGHAANGAGASAAAAGGPDDASPAKRRRGPLDHVVPVPTDVAEAAATCPVCQERFDVSWHDETQTPVWTNAVRVGRKVFHKTCYDEVYGQPAAGAGPGRNSPSVLGKRKLDIGM